MFKQAIWHATQWLLIIFIMDLIFEPISWLLHRESGSLRGLIRLVWQAPDRGQAVLVVIGVVIVIWVALVLFFWLIEGLRRAMGRHDVY